MQPTRNPQRNRQFSSPQPCALKPPGPPPLPPSCYEPEAFWPARPTQALIHSSDPAVVVQVQTTQAQTPQPRVQGLAANLQQAEGELSAYKETRLERESTSRRCCRDTGEKRHRCRTETRFREHVEATQAGWHKFPSKGRECEAGCQNLLLPITKTKGIEWDPGRL